MKKGYETSMFSLPFESLGICIVFGFKLKFLVICWLWKKGRKSLLLLSLGVYYCITFKWLSQAIHKLSLRKGKYAFTHMAENQITASRSESYMGQRLLKPENKWLQINWDAFYKKFVSVNHMYLFYILNLL